MIAVLSPAKTLDFEPVETAEVTTPRLMNATGTLVKTLKKKSVADIQQLMSVSEKIAQLNKDRYQAFKAPFTIDNAKPSILAFKGDVYTGLEADTFGKRDMNFAQKHIRILSGLYGVLKPLDLMQAYRLEMGTRLEQGKHKNLYSFWGNRITKLINEDLADIKSKLIVNLASIEYFRSINTDELNADVLNIHFKENRNGKYKVIAFNAKKARGRMANLMVKERIKKPENLKTLVVNDYVYNDQLSEGMDWVWTKA